MRMLKSRTLPCLLVALFGAAPAGAAEQDSTARLREMLHRTQEALRQAQTESAELGRAKADAEQKAAALEKKLEGTQASVSRSEKASQAQAQELEAAQQKQTDTEKKLAEATATLSTTNAKLSEVTKQLAGREAELATASQALEKSRGEHASCEAKNATLYRYSQELLQQYKQKGVWAAVRQKEPVLGLREVEVENAVQDYQHKLDEQRLQSP